ncbi:MAG: TetR/AcrR family transcriptional regulator [Trueperaceae bacterium]|nr:TetR/AcrR family transcriptional regulator [Trueperaceae bacterium]
MSALPRPTTARGEATRGKLLAAAEAEFGENGFASTAVSDITRRAGVAQGTFYLYFPTKADALRQLVQDMGRQLRHALTEGTAGARDRLEVERLGLEAFIDFALEHQNLYKVVMESQFVDDSIYRESIPDARRLLHGQPAARAGARRAAYRRRQRPGLGADGRGALPGLALRHLGAQQAASERAGRHLRPARAWDRARRGARSMSRPPAGPT